MGRDFGSQITSAFNRASTALTNKGVQNADAVWNRNKGIQDNASFKSQAQRDFSNRNAMAIQNLDQREQARNERRKARYNIEAPEDSSKWASLKGDWVGQGYIPAEVASTGTAQAGFGALKDTAEKASDSIRRKQEEQRAGNVDRYVGRQDGQSAMSRLGFSYMTNEFRRNPAGDTQSYMANPYINKNGMTDQQRAQWTEQLSTSSGTADTSDMPEDQKQRTDEDAGVAPRNNNRPATADAWYSTYGYEMPSTVKLDPQNRPVYTIDGTDIGWIDDAGNRHVGNVADYTQAAMLAHLNSVNPYIAESYGDSLGQFLNEAGSDPNIDWDQDIMQGMLGFGNNERLPYDVSMILDPWDEGGKLDFADEVALMRGIAEMTRNGVIDASQYSKDNPLTLRDLTADQYARIATEDWADEVLAPWGGVYAADLTPGSEAYNALVEYMKGFNPALVDQYGANGDQNMVNMYTGTGGMALASRNQNLADSGWNPMYDYDTWESMINNVDTDAYNTLDNYYMINALAQDYDGNERINLDAMEPESNLAFLNAMTLGSQAEMLGHAPNDYTLRVVPAASNRTHPIHLLSPQYSTDNLGLFETADWSDELMEPLEGWSRWKVDPRLLIYYSNPAKLLTTDVASQEDPGVIGWRAY